jgi:superfamily II DNA or RNA helicase
MTDSEKIARLEEEIRYLHGLLDAHGIPYRKIIPPENPLVSPKERITPDMARLFYSYFQGRKDVFSRRAPMKNGRFGYFPACFNFWKQGICPKASGEKIRCQDCRNKKYIPLSPSVLMAHLKGEKKNTSDVVSIYPLLPDNTCNFLVFDFDNHEEEKNDTLWQEEAGALAQICRENHIDALVERSRSGHGAHVWIFFASPIPAAEARKFGNALLAKGAESVNLQGFTAYDRMMPMQDSLPDGGLGNLIALPLQGMALKNGNSAFVDKNWHVIPDQWAALKNTRKLTPAEIDEKIKLWSPLLPVSSYRDNPADSSRPWKKDLPSFDKTDIEGTLSITMADGIYIDKSNLKPRMQNHLRRMAAYSNPEFYKKYALGYSTYGTPRIIYRGYDTGKYIHLPRGCAESLITGLKKDQISFTISDKRQKGRAIAVSFKGRLYPEQQDAVDALLPYHTGILNAATAFGKTAAGAALIACRKTTALILVQNREILKNWETDLPKFLEINEQPPVYTTPTGRVRRRRSVIGTLYSARNTMTGIVDIAMISSLVREDRLPLLKNYGLVIMDECHHAGAETDEKVLSEVSASYVYGLTATPKRSDGQDKRVLFQFGPIRYQYTARDRAKKQGIGHYIYPRFTSLTHLFSQKPTLPELYDLIAKSPSRNLQIIKDTETCVKEGRTPLVMTKYKSHAAYLYSHLKDKADHVFLLQGGQSRRENDRIRSAMAAVPASESMILVAIGKYIGEGFNYPRLDTLLLAMPISWQGNVEQYAGRLNRDYETKKEVIIFDYIDARIPILEKMYTKRLATYKRIGFSLKTDLAETQHVENAIFDFQSYLPVYEKDLLSAQKEIIISSPGLSIRKVSRFVKLTASLQERGVKITILTLPPDIYPETARKWILKSQALLEKAGIQVINPDVCHEHFAVIDRSICWYGSMNLLSREKEEDSLMRLVSPKIAEELVQSAAAKLPPL